MSRYSTGICFERDQALNIVGKDSGCGGVPHAWDYLHIEQFSDVAFEPDPFDNIAGRKLQDLHTAPGIGIASFLFCIERESG